MSVANKVLVYRWYEEVWNKQNERVIDELLSDDIVLYGLSESPTEFATGPAAFKKYWRTILTALPDIQISVESTIAEDEKVVARCRVRATHLGEGLGVPPTGKKIHITGISISTFSNGKAIEAWNSFDMLSIYRQIGAFPARPKG